MNENDSPLNEKSKVTIQTEHQAKSILNVTTLPKNSEVEPLDTSVIDEQWAEMSQDWQSQPTTKTDIAKLLKQTKKRTVWAKLSLAVDIIATLGIISVAIYMWLSGSQDKATMIYLGFSGVFSAIFVFYVIKIRLSTWKVNCGSPDKAIKNAIIAGESSLSYIKLLKISCYVIWPFANWYVFAITQQMEKSPTSGLLFANGLIVVVWLITHKFSQKRTEELKQLKAILPK